MGRRRVRMTNKPSYRFAGYTEPWEQKKLGEVAESFDYGLNASAKEFDGVNKYIRITDIDDFSNEFLKTNLTSPDVKIDESSDYLLSEGDILFARTGASTGKTYYYKKTDGVVFFAGFLIRARIKENNDYKFIFQNTLTKNFKKYVDITSQRSGQPGVNAKEYANFLLSLPSLPEQTTIGSFFQELDQLISLQQRKLEVLKEQKKTYLKLLFPAKGQTKPTLRFAGFEDEWKEVKLGEVFDIVTDYVANGSFESLRNNVKTYEKDNFAYMIRLQDASNSWKGPWLYTDEKGYNFLSKSRLFKDDILMSNVGTVGRFFQVPELDRPMTLAPNSVLIRSTSSNNQFLYFMMLTANIQDQITMRKTPGVQDKINKTDFKKVIATLPSLPEQQTIGAFLQDLDKAISKQEEKVNQLKESKQTLLRKMFI